MGVLDHRPHPLTPEHAGAIERLHIEYWGTARKSAENIRSYGTIFDTSADYVHVRRLALQALDQKAGTVSILDFGAGAGTLMRFIRKERPEILSRLNYVAVEPTDAYRPALAEACEGVEHEIIAEHLSVALIERLKRPFDLFVATGAFIYIRPDLVQGLFSALNAQTILLRDWFGLGEADPEFMYFLHNPTFPMFAHNWRRLLKATGYALQEIEPSIWENDGYSWHVALVERAAR